MKQVTITSRIAIIITLWAICLELFKMTTPLLVIGFYKGYLDKLTLKLALIRMYRVAKTVSVILKSPQRYKLSYLTHIRVCKMNGSLQTVH